MELIERYKGALVGVHVGDSLGAPYEKTFSARAIARDIAERGGLKMFDYDNPWGNETGDANGLRLPAGRPTDDSDQTADLAYSLITCNGLDTEHVRECLRDSVVRGKSRLWSGQGTGAGGTTKRALSDDPAHVAEALQNNIGTNGSLMRCAPMGLWMGSICHKNAYAVGYNDNVLVSNMSSVTHTHPHSVGACWIYTLVLSGLLDEFSPEESWRQLSVTEYWLHWNLHERLQARLFDQDCFPYDPGAWPMRGTAEFSLYVALYALMKTESFAEGIELAIRVGGDTDTYAAIAGGLLGAYYGYEAIPKDWRETILGHDAMVSYAEQLYAMRLNQ